MTSLTTIIIGIGGLIIGTITMPISTLLINRPERVTIRVDGGVVIRVTLGRLSTRP